MTEATVRISPLPEHEEFIAVFFPDFAGAATAVRQVVQGRWPLSLLRLSTPRETQTTLALAVLIDPQASGQLELSYEPCTDTPTPASQAATFLAADPGTPAVWQGERRRWTWAWSPE